MYIRLRGKIRQMLHDLEQRKWEEILEECADKHKLWPLLKKLRRNTLPNHPLEDSAGKFRYLDIKKAEITAFPKWAEIAEFLSRFLENHLPTYDNDPVQTEIPALPDAIKFETEHLLSAARNLNPKKATGYDGIPVKAIKYLGLSDMTALNRVYNSFVNEFWYPDHWRVASVVTIPKSGKDSQKLENRRPISITPELSRFFEKLLVNFVKDEIERTEAVHPAQFGFSQGIGAIYQASHLAALARIAEATNKKMLIALMDIEKAYDSVPREKVLEKMRSKG